MLLGLSFTSTFCIGRHVELRPITRTWFAFTLIVQTSPYNIKERCMHLPMVPKDVNVVIFCVIEKESSFMLCLIKYSCKGLECVYLRMHRVVGPRVVSHDLPWTERLCTLCTVMHACIAITCPLAAAPHHYSMQEKSAQTTWEELGHTSVLEKPGGVESPWGGPVYSAMREIGHHFVGIYPKSGGRGSKPVPLHRFLAPLRRQTRRLSRMGYII